MKRVIIARYTKPEEAYLAVSVLEGSGVDATVRDANTVHANLMYSNAIGGVKVEVPEDQVGRAKEILEIPKDTESLLECPHCGSHHVRLRELNIFTAIGVFIGLLLPITTRKADCYDCGKTFLLNLEKEKKAPNSKNSE